MGAAVAAAAWLAASPASAHPVCSSQGFTDVEVEPAGNAIAGDLQSGTSAVFAVSGISVSCSASHTSGTIPVSGNPGDEVIGSLTAPTFTSCGSATTTTSGTWQLGISCGGHADLTIPKGGAVTKVLTCTATVAPNGPATISGTYTAAKIGDPAAQATLCFNTTVPVKVTGFLCPTGATSASFQACYNVNDTTTGLQDITITPLP